MERIGKRSNDEPQKIVDAICKCIQENEDGTWWMDNLKAVEIIRRALEGKRGLPLRVSEVTGM